MNILLLLMILGQAQAYIGSGGKPVKLCETPVLIFENDYLDPRVFASIRDGIEYWNKTLGKQILLSIDDPLPSQIHHVVFVVEQDGPPYNVACGRTISEYTQNTGCVERSTIIFYKECYGDKNNIVDNARMVSIARHELGHLMGLDHVEQMNDLMNPQPWPFQHPISASPEAISLLKSYYVK